MKGIDGGDPIYIILGLVGTGLGLTVVFGVVGDLTGVGEDQSNKAEVEDFVGTVEEYCSEEWTVSTTGEIDLFGQNTVVTFYDEEWELREDDREEPLENDISCGSIDYLEHGEDTDELRLQSGSHEIEVYYDDSEESTVLERVD